MLPEKELIERIRKGVQRGFAVRTLARGIGDDCAIVRLRAGHEALVTTDFSLEGIHFRREWHPPDSVGHRCLARGLSDIAAMGGEPVAAFLSLALPATLTPAWVDGFLRGFLRLARRFRVPLAGGDTARSAAGVLADIVVLGSAPKGQAVLRSGARFGDGIYVTGGLGASAGALAALRAGKKLRPGQYPAHFYPVPRVKVGLELRNRSLATAMIDISDGLSTDLAHICQESRVGAAVWQEKVPVAAEGNRATEFALHGGEDYELLFTSRRRLPEKVAGVAITHIGEITREKKMILVDARGQRQPFRARGWEHFR